MREITGLNLKPTYSYWRLYKTGDVLKRHKDRPSCEVSTTLCLGYNNTNLKGRKKDWEKYERGEAGIPKLLKNKSEQDIANVLLLMFLVFTMPLSIILVAVYYFYSDKNNSRSKQHFTILIRIKSRI